MAIRIKNQARAHAAMLVGIVRIGMRGIDEILAAGSSDPLVGDMHVPDWRPNVIGHQTPREFPD